MVVRERRRFPTLAKVYLAMARVRVGVSFDLMTVGTHEIVNINTVKGERLDRPDITFEEVVLN